MFRTDKLKKQLNDDKLLLRHYGAIRAKLLARRLAQLRAAPTLEAVRAAPGRCHELKGDRKGELSLDLDGPYRLLFSPAHDPLPIAAGRPGLGAGDGSGHPGSGGHA